MVEKTPVKKVLIFGGKTGWIGGKMAELCEEKGATTFLNVFICVHLHTVIYGFIN